MIFKEENFFKFKKNILGKGGEFVFDLPQNKIQYPQNVGDAIIFPSNFMFPHQVNQITEGTRYALIAWVI